MAITSTSSLYDAQAVSPICSKKNRVEVFSYLDAVGGQGTASVLLLPKGKIRIDFEKSRITPADAGESAVLSVGYGGYIDARTHATVAADPNAFLDAYAIDDSPEATAFVAPIGEDPQTDFNTTSGLVITLTVAGGDSDAEDAITGYVAYVFLDD